MEAPKNPTLSEQPIRFAMASVKDYMNYSVVAQSADEVRDPQNAPSVSMGPYLISSEQTRLLTTLSIYGMRGTTRDQLRLLYMNATALRIWREMGRKPTIVAMQHRPPHASLLTYGVPFSS